MGFFLSLYIKIRTHFPSRLISATLTALLICSSTMYANPPKREVRAVWLTTIGGLDWPHSYSQTASSMIRQQMELCTILDSLKAANVNTVLLQTRIRGTVIYPSRYEPYDGCLSGFPGVSPGYDALAFAIDECHRRGMELHAWVVCIPIGKAAKLGASRFRRKYPQLYLRQGDESYMNPSKSGTADYIASICEEITRNYDVDGIHLDYIRYPETFKPVGTAESRRSNITRIVNAVHSRVKALKPWVKLSCSPVGKYSDLTLYTSYGWNARETVSQDAQMWLQTGLMDQLYPMMYFRGNQFYPFAVDWNECSCGRTVVPGLGVYLMSSKEKDWNLDVITREMYFLRSYGMGHAYFRSKFFTDNTKGIYDFTAGQFDTYPALVPAATWISSSIPEAPTGVKVARTTDYDVITWQAAENHSGAPALLYNVYASTAEPVDIGDVRNLVAMRLSDTSAAFKRQPRLAPFHYAVTTIDRYGNESTSSDYRYARVFRPSKADYLHDGENVTNHGTTFGDLGNRYFPLTVTDGRTLTLPVKTAALDADVVVVNSLAGTIIATRPYRGTSIDISSLSPGVYTLSSLNAKGVTHRLLMFIIPDR